MDARGRWGLTPLHSAVIHRHEAAIAALLQLGADRTAVSDGGETPWQLAQGRITSPELLVRLAPLGAAIPAMTLRARWVFVVVSRQEEYGE
ncbi:ankyrin repeat domain-containing protein [Trinickia acidisoli]|uniref:ankyrin repeat domain-containing protein n=1 Tax=Trinickia acidisoli TaxID=2767482 RepID=UPI001A8DC84D|nr:ankyrin repeat domain-containing protein [Trinickia acidisoli]